jgi:hypothetical protein
MSELAEPKQRKLHVNLTLRADLYGTAQAHAKAEGLSVSALFERILLSMAMGGPRPELDTDLSAMRGILRGPWADLGKREARAARHEERIGKGGR